MEFQTALKIFAYVHKLATLHSNADAPRLHLSLLEISKNKKSHIITSDLVIWVCQKEFLKSFENNRLFVKVQLLTLCKLYLMLSLRISKNKNKSSFLTY